MSKRDDLAKRIKTFILNVIFFLRKLPKTEENRIFVKQLLRSVSSIGANFAEALYAHSRQDFLHVINICRKELNESVFWLELLSDTNPLLQKDLEPLLDEGKQLLRIFISSVKTAKENSNK